jgi:hypothetical protein
MTDGKLDNEGKNTETTKKRVVKRAKSPDAQSTSDQSDQSEQSRSPKKKVVVKRIKPKSVEVEAVPTSPTKLIRQLQIDYSHQKELFDNISRQLEKTDKKQYAKLTQLSNHIRDQINLLTNGTATTEEIQDCQSSILSLESELTTSPYLISHQKTKQQFVDFHQKNIEWIEKLFALRPFRDQINTTNQHFIDSYLKLEENIEKFSTPAEIEEYTKRIIELNQMFDRSDIQAIIRRDYTRTQNDLERITTQQTQVSKDLNAFFNQLNQLKVEDIKLLSKIQPSHEKYTQLIKNIQFLIAFFEKNKSHLDAGAVSSLISALKERTDTSRVNPYTPLTLINSKFFADPETQVAQINSDKLDEINRNYQTLSLQLSQDADLFPILSQTITNSMLYRSELTLLHMDYINYTNLIQASSEKMIEEPSVLFNSPGVTRLKKISQDKTTRFQMIADELESMFNIWGTKTILDPSVLEAYKSKFRELQNIYQERLIAVQGYNSKIQEVQENVKNKIYFSLELAKKEFKSSLAYFFNLLESLEGQAFSFQTLPDDMKPAFKILFKQIESSIKHLQDLSGQVLDRQKVENLVLTLKECLRNLNADRPPSQSTFSLSPSSSSAFSLTAELDSIFLPIDPTLPEQIISKHADLLLSHATDLTSETHKINADYLLLMAEIVKAHQTLAKQQQTFDKKFTEHNNKLINPPPSLNANDKQRLLERVNSIKTKETTHWQIYSEVYRNAKNATKDELIILRREQEQLAEALQKAVTELDKEGRNLAYHTVINVSILPQEELRNLLGKAKKINATISFSSEDLNEAIDKAEKQLLNAPKPEDSEARQKFNKRVENDSLVLKKAMKQLKDAIDQSEEQLFSSRQPKDPEARQMFNARLENCSMVLRNAINNYAAELEKSVKNQGTFLRWYLKLLESTPNARNVPNTKEMIRKLEFTLEKEEELYTGPDPSIVKKMELLSEIHQIHSETIEMVQKTPLSQKFIYILQFIEELAAELVTKSTKKNTMLTEQAPSQYLLNRKLDKALDEINPDLPKLASFYRKIHKGYQAYLGQQKTNEPPEVYINRQVQKLKNYTADHGYLDQFYDFMSYLLQKIVAKITGNKMSNKYHLHFFENDEVREKVKKLQPPEVTSQEPTNTPKQ